MQQEERQETEETPEETQHIMTRERMTYIVWCADDVVHLFVGSLF